MEKEYIERGALLEELQEEIVFESAMYTEEQNKWLCTGLRIATRDVRKQPTADVVPREAYEALMINYERMRRNQFPSYCQAVTEEEAMKIGYERGRAEVAKIFEEIESVLFTVANPCPSADGTIIVKHSKDFYLRREDYYTIKEKYTKGGVEE